MELNIFDPERVLVQRDQMLAVLRQHLSLGDFVLIRNTLNKHIDEAIAENRSFEEAIRADNDPFVTDVRNEDPLAFIVRGALHLEERVTALLSDLQVKLPKKPDFNDKIRALEASGKFSMDGILLLDRIRLLRNAVAHELESGRDVPQGVVDELKSCLTTDRLTRMHRICGADPLLLPAGLFLRFVMNNVYNELDGTARRLRWEADYKRILPPEARDLAQL